MPAIRRRREADAASIVPMSAAERNGVTSQEGPAQGVRLGGGDWHRADGTGHAAVGMTKTGGVASGLFLTHSPAFSRTAKLEC